MAENLVKDLITAGVHFGHRTSRWNPKMAPYIYAKKNQIHVMDIRETVRGLLRAKKYLKRVAEGGSLILFAGTKRQASGIIEREAARCGMPFVSERWLVVRLLTSARFEIDSAAWKNWKRCVRVMILISTRKRCSPR